MATLKYFFIDFGLSLVRFPLWWYSEGLVFMVKRLFSSVRHYSQSISLSVWFKNLFTPMFGQRDWQSRIISFFMRLFQIVGRSLFLLLWTILMIIIFAVYLVAPVIVLFGLVFQLFGTLFFA